MSDRMACPNCGDESGWSIWHTRDDLDSPVFLWVACADCNDDGLKPKPKTLYQIFRPEWTKQSSQTVYLHETKMFQDWLKEKGLIWPRFAEQQEELIAQFHREAFERGNEGKEKS